MHNIDRSTNEYEFENEFEFEGEGEFEFGLEVAGEHEFEFEFETGLETEAHEMEMATELLGVSNEMELEQFLGKLVRRAVKGATDFAKSSVGKSLIGGLKSIAKKALPTLAGAAGNFLLPGVGGIVGSKLGSMASSMFELELEGLSNEDREFEVARRYVRLASDASRRAGASAASGASPAAVVSSSLKKAAYNHAPGLLRRRQGGGIEAGFATTANQSGNWRRRGNAIIVYGV